ncbi:MAG TPA: nickel insertion protein [Candidatus Limnocylindria bacterium]|nr:nickel insertion protein [Candidatus Limnocylindria bacterium]
MRIAYFDCSAGAAGDMLLAALLDAGAPLDRLIAVRDALGLGDELEIAIDEIPLGARRAARLRLTERGPAVERQLPAALAAIDRSGLPEAVRRAAARTIGRLGAVESRIHGVPLERLQLHELSAADTLLDVVGFHALCAALAVEAVEASPINVGGGTITFSHGTFPVPPPATAELLRSLPTTREGPEAGELTTPTAAAILATTVRRFGPPPPREGLIRLGSAVGSRRTDPPRVLRCLVMNIP